MMRPVTRTVGPGRGSDDGPSRRAVLATGVTGGLGLLLTGCGLHVERGASVPLPWPTQEPPRSVEPVRRQLGYVESAREVASAARTTVPEAAALAAVHTTQQERLRARLAELGVEPSGTASGSGAATSSSTETPSHSSTTAASSPSATQPLLAAEQAGLDSATADIAEAGPTDARLVGAVLVQRGAAARTLGEAPPGLPATLVVPVDDAQVRARVGHALAAAQYGLEVAAAQIETAFLPTARAHLDSVRARLRANRPAHPPAPGYALPLRPHNPATARRLGQTVLIRLVDALMYELMYISNNAAWLLEWAVADEAAARTWGAPWRALPGVPSTA